MNVQERVNEIIEAAKTEGVSLIVHELRVALDRVEEVERFARDREALRATEEEKWKAELAAVNRDREASYRLVRERDAEIDRLLASETELTEKVGTLTADNARLAVLSSDATRAADLIRERALINQTNMEAERKQLEQSIECFKQDINNRDRMYASLKETTEQRRQEIQRWQGIAHERRREIEELQTLAAEASRKNHTLFRLVEFLSGFLPPPFSPQDPQAPGASPL